MTTENCLIEIGCEELPFGFLKRMDADLTGIIDQQLDKSQLGCDCFRFYLSPRRIVFYIQNCRKKTEENVIRVRGPKSDMAYENGKPTRVLEGFLKSRGCDLSECIVENGYVHIVRHEKVPEVKKLVPILITEVMNQVYQPKTMFWKDRQHRFIRPVRWICALLGSEVLEFEFRGIRADRVTSGHRFLSKGMLHVKNADDYFEMIKNAGVVSDHRDRYSIIEKEVRSGNGEFSEKLGWENAFLVENPCVFREKLPEQFMILPRAVLRTVLNKQQRYFTCSEENKALPYFIAVANNTPNQLIREGNLKVLNARLTDALFFFKNDLKQDLKKKAEGLKDIVFHQDLGNMAQKCERMGKIASAAAELTGIDQQEFCWEDFASLLKSDMMTEMVFEFPELQGTMGEIYLRELGYPESLCRAVCEHYLPVGQNEELPVTAAGKIYALADKIDTLTAFFSAGITPTGSKDPFALRRTALGLLKIIIDSGFDLSLSRLVDLSFAELEKVASCRIENPKAALMMFLKERFYHMMKETCQYDLIEAVCETGFDSPADTLKRLRALAELSRESKFREFVLLALRINNILKGFSEGQIQISLCENDAEKKLVYSLETLGPEIDRLIAEADYASAFGRMLEFADPISIFFEQVMVNCDNPELKKNRMAMLNSLQKVFLKLFSVEKISSKNERK